MLSPLDFKTPNRFKSVAQKLETTFKRRLES